MTTLITIYKSDRIVGRCDARCYNSTRPECNCCCCGINHGVGLDQARANNKRITWAGDKDLKVVKENQQ